MVPLTKLPSYLPDLCLENIFKRIPLSDLLGSVRVVCTNWHRVMPSEMRRRRSLVLLRDYSKDVQTKLAKLENRFESDLIEYVRREDGSPWVRLRPLDQICTNALIVPSGVLTERFTLPLMDTLPTITHLTIVQCDIPKEELFSILTQIVCLLNCYGKHLISLKLDLTGRNYYNCTVNETCDLSKPNFTVLFDSINQLESLRHHTLNFLVYFRDSSRPALTILSRLNTFSANTFGRWLYHSVAEYATRNVDWSWPWELKNVAKLDPQLTCKFSSVSVSHFLTALHSDNMNLFGTLFTSLSRLTLFIDTMPMAMMARCLSPLNQLIYLNLEFNRILPADDQMIDPQLEYVQLPSVSFLLLSIVTRSHLDTDRLHVAQIFPNLQVLNLVQEIVRCDVCEYDVAERAHIDPEELDARVEQCIRLARQPFRPCANLHTIKHEGKFIFYHLFPHNLMITRDEF